MIADLIRWGDAALALVMCLAVPPCLLASVDWWQRLRFVTMFGYGVITVSGQIDALGLEPTWRTFALLPITVGAAVGTVQYALRAMRTWRGGDGARS